MADKMQWANFTKVYHGDKWVPFAILEVSISGSYQKYKNLSGSHPIRRDYKWVPMVDEMHSGSVPQMNSRVISGSHSHIRNVYQWVLPKSRLMCVPLNKA